MTAKEISEAKARLAGEQLTTKIESAQTKSNDIEMSDADEEDEDGTDLFDTTERAG